MCKTFAQPDCAETLCDYSRLNFQEADCHSVYEAGFSSFWTHHKLKAVGINNMITNPRNVPTSQKEQLQKDDPTDSRKFAC